MMLWNMSMWYNYDGCKKKIYYFKVRKIKMLNVVFEKDELDKFI